MLNASAVSRQGGRRQALTHTCSGLLVRESGAGRETSVPAPARSHAAKTSALEPSKIHLVGVDF